MHQVERPEGAALRIESRLNQFSQTLMRFDARLRGLEAQFKSATSSTPTLFQKRLENPMQTLQKSLTHFLRTGEIAFQKGLSATDSTGNSITLPHQQQEVVERAVPDYSPLRRLAKVSNITGEALELLVDQGNGDAGWVQEKDPREETAAPELLKVKINVHEMYARPRATQKLLDDVGVDLEQWLTTKIAWQMGAMENRAFISGDGAGKPKGFLSYPTAKIGEGSFGKIESIDSKAEASIDNPDVLVDLFHAMKPEYLEGAVWMMARSTLAQVRKLKDKQGNYIFTQNSEDPSILGHQVIITDDMPAPAKDSLSIVFANFGHAYQIVERQDIQVLRDPYSAKPYIEFYATKRVGGDVINFDAIKVIRFSK